MIKWLSQQNELLVTKLYEPECIIQQIQQMKYFNVEIQSSHFKAWPMMVCLMQSSRSILQITDFYKHNIYLGQMKL